MLTSLAYIFLVGFSLGAICQKIRLPRIIGMLVTGILLGPFVLDLLDSTILGISRANAYSLMHTRGFPTLQIGKRMVVPKDKLIAWINENSES